MFCNLWFFANRFPSGNVTLINIILPASVLLQSFAACHISYYRRKFRKQDDTVYSIYIPPPQHENNVPNTSRNPPSVDVQLNTNQYNDILYGVGSMLVFSGFLILLLVISFCVPNLFQSNAIFYVVHYIDLVTFFVFNVFIPCLFYICNPSARLYTKKLFMGE